MICLTKQIFIWRASFPEKSAGVSVQQHDFGKSLDLFEKNCKKNFSTGVFRGIIDSMHNS